MSKVWWAAACALALAACGGGAPPSGAHWKQVGGLDGGFVRFVAVDDAGLKDMAVYREAAAAVCRDSCFQLGFYGPDDRTPQETTR